MKPRAKLALGVVFALVVFGAGRAAAVAPEAKKPESEPPEPGPHGWGSQVGPPPNWEDWSDSKLGSFILNYIAHWSAGKHGWADVAGWAHAMYVYLVQTVSNSDDLSESDKAALVKMLGDIRNADITPVQRVAQYWRFGSDGSDGNAPVWQDPKTMYVEVSGAMFEGEGGGPPEDWEEGDVDADGDGEPDPVFCLKRAWPWEGIFAALESQGGTDDPADYGLPTFEWAKLAAAWNAIDNQTHCWRLTDAMWNTAQGLPGPELWQNLGAPPPHVRMAAAELYLARYPHLFTNWSDAEAELKFVTDHLLA